MFGFEAVDRIRLPIDTEEEYLICLTCPTCRKIVRLSKPFSGKVWLLTHLPIRSKTPAYSSYTNECSVPISFANKNLKIIDGFST